AVLRSFYDRSVRRTFVARSSDDRRTRGSTGSPQTLFGPARLIVTSTSCPSHCGGPGKLTTVLPLVRPVSSHSRRRLAASTSTWLVDPIERWERADWIHRWEGCHAPSTPR